MTLDKGFIIRQLKKRGMAADGTFRDGYWYLTVERHYAYTPPTSIEWLTEPSPTAALVKIVVIRDVEIDDNLLARDFEYMAQWLDGYLNAEFERELKARRDGRVT